MKQAFPLKSEEITWELKGINNEGLQNQKWHGEWS